MAIDTNSKAYKSLLDKGYTADQIQQMHSSVASGQNAKDVIANTKIGSTPISTASTNATNSTTNNNTVYAGANKAATTATQTASQVSSQNAGYNTNQANNQTYINNGNNSFSNTKAMWDNLSYAQQQERLNQISGLKDALTKRGWTIKTEGVTPVKSATSTTTETPKTGRWDYQDNSPERMAEIASNLEGYKQTMSYLFNDKNAFDNFFINGKGRSKEQVDFLNDWFYKNQKYGKYDVLTPDSIGYGIAYGDIPEDYLTMLKTTDPAKYQAVLQAKQDAEDKIKDKTALDTTSILSGDNEATITSKAIEWLKTQGLFLDNDGNLIDDRTENYATDEEKDYAKNAADIIARNLDIDNTVKHTYDDLVKAYPGATKATLMAMAQDRNSDLLREKENNNVELTRLQGYIDYMQSERQERNKIGENAINQLQKQYGMYYQYTPEGMSELAQAQYAATNVTLDQADSGNETQKQMALQSVLDDYYAKYGSIIQRSEQQVINDVIAYAKKNGIGLAQALQENFVKPLQQKPQFATLSTGGSLTADKWAKLSDNTLYNVTTGETISTDGGNVNVTTSRGETITPISSAANQEATNNLRNKYPIGSSYKNGECGELMNLDAANAGSNIHFGSYLSDKTKWINRETYEGPQVGDYVVFDWTNKPGANEDMKKYGHVGKIVDVKDGSIYIRNQNGTVSGKVSIDKYPLKDYEQYIAGYVDPTKTEDYGYWGSPLDDQFSAIQNASSKLNKDQKEALDFADSAYMMMYKLASSGDLDYFLKSPDGQKVLSNYATAQFSNNANYTEDQILSTLKNNVTDQRILGIVNDLMTIIEKKLRWTSGAAISGSEWNSNSKMLIPQAGESYGTQFRKFQTFEGEYLKKPFDTMGRYAGVNTNYIPLFDGKSPYYTKYVVSAEQEADEAI